jgi:predicted phosphoribosyltransferase
VGRFYQNFEQTTDEEVRTLLSHARAVERRSQKCAIRAGRDPA